MKNKDKKVFDLITKEEQRQKHYVELIASENFVSNQILEATGSVLTNKYAEGYPNARYYGGCEIIDQVAELARERLKKIFNVNYVNVQPHSGSQTNAAAYMALLKPGDKILGMSICSGGHLTHGYFVSFSGIIYEAHNYDVDKETQTLNYEEILEIAKKVKPKLIICGASAYSKEIDFKKFKKIADEVGAYLLADIAHIAGLVVAGLHQSPIKHCDVITSTTHKTLRGPRGGIIMTNGSELAKKIDKAIFPGSQGGPLMHVIAAKAICFAEASTTKFINYQKEVIKNAKALASFFLKKRIEVISGGTDNHLLMLNVKKGFNLTGLEAENLLFEANIVVNKNTIPFDPEKPTITSGIRIGTPAMTTKGFKQKDFLAIAQIIFDVLSKKDLSFAKKKKREAVNLLLKLERKKK